MDRKQCALELQAIESELEIMLKVDSLYTLNLKEVYYDDQYLHIVMECINNVRDLAEMINDLPDKRFGEDDAKTIISQVLKGLSHLHSLNICHRDLKLENVLWSSED